MQYVCAAIACIFPLEDCQARDEGVWLCQFSWYRERLHRSIAQDCPPETQQKAASTTLSISIIRRRLYRSSFFGLGRRLFIGKLALHLGGLQEIRERDPEQMPPPEAYRFQALVLRDRNRQVCSIQQPCLTHELLEVSQRWLVAIGHQTLATCPALLCGLLHDL